MDPATATMIASGPAAHLTAEPEYDHAPSRDRRIVRELSGRDWPERATEPASGQGTAGCHQEADDRRAEEHRKHAEMAADQQHVTSAPPRRQQPERDYVPSEPEGTEHGTEVLRLQGREDRPYDEQGHQEQEHIRAHDTPAVQAQRHDERNRQGSLRYTLADDRRDMEEGYPRVEGQGVEEQQAIGDIEPASQTVFVRLRQCRRGRPHATAGADRDD